MALELDVEAGLSRELLYRLGEEGLGLLDVATARGDGLVPGRGVHDRRLLVEDALIGLALAGLREDLGIHAVLEGQGSRLSSKGLRSAAMELKRRTWSGETTLLPSSSSIRRAMRGEIRGTMSTFPASSIATLASMSGTKWNGSLLASGSPFCQSSGWRTSSAHSLGAMLTT